MFHFPALVLFVGVVANLLLALLFIQFYLNNLGKLANMTKRERNYQISLQFATPISNLNVSYIQGMTNFTVVKILAYTIHSFTQAAYFCE